MTTFRRLLAAAAAVAAGGLLAAGGPVRAAEPFVGTVGEATGAVKIRGTDGKTYELRLRFVSTTPASGSASYALETKLSVCSSGSCTGSPKTYVRRLAAADVEVAEDFTSAEVATVLFGRGMTVAWTTEGSTAISPPNAGVFGPGAHASTGNPVPADLRVTAFGLTCRAVGDVYSAATVATEGYATPYGQAPPSRGPAGLGPRGRSRPSCAA